jgi:hypothetical protein
VRHLLILKEVMHSLEADFRQRDDGKGFERSLGSSKAVEFPSTGVTGASSIIESLRSEISRF